MKRNNKFNIDSDSLRGEIWKPVTNFEDRFKISNMGRLLSISGRYGGRTLMTPAIDTLGYYVSTLRSYDWETKEVKQRAVRIHTLVAEHFLTKPEGKNICVNHLDGNKLSNHILNLEWTTLGENIKHAVRIGLFDCKGEKHYAHKLTKDQVIFCRKNYVRYSKEFGSNALAKRFGIAERNMRDVISGETWAWLKEA